METLNINLSEHIIPIEIEGHKFSMNIDDPEVYQALNDFKSQFPQQSMSNIDDMITACNTTIDKVLGANASSLLFCGKKTMQSYLLVNELSNIYLNNFMREEREKQAIKVKEEIDNINRITSSLERMNNVTQFVEKKYGAMNANRASRRNKH